MADRPEGLEANCEAVAELVREVCKASGEKVPNFAFGLSERHRQQAAPRVVWVPVGAQVKKEHVTRGHVDARTLYNRRWMVQARVWCDTFEDCEKLVRHIVAAGRDYWSGFSFSYVSEEIDTEGDMTHGFLDVLTFALDIPLRDEPLGIVQPTEAPVDGTITTEVA